MQGRADARDTADAGDKADARGKPERKLDARRGGCAMQDKAD
jgi:hypothetical protein